MNRIILVGNGFDLAHGLKSSYSDFMLDLLKQKINLAVKEGITTNNSINKTGYYYEDILFSIFIQKTRNINNDIKDISKINDLDKLFNLRKKGLFEIDLKSNILKNFIDKWADFEKCLFDRLIELHQDNGDIEGFNNESSLLRKYLKEYILRVQIDIESSNIDKARINMLIEIFCEGNLNEILFLSFNYTRTLGYYFNKIQHKIKSNIIYIHGNVNEIKEDDELIFGYDNDLDDGLNKIYSELNIDYLNFIKSNLYNNNTSKRELIEFLSLDKFDVYTFGHSLELSDFTILREIFSHDNCNRIKVYFHPLLNYEDYNKKRNLLSLMFKDKKDHSKLVERNISEPMPILIPNVKSI